MASAPFDKVLGILWERRRDDVGVPYEALRANMDALAFPVADDIAVTPALVGGLPAEWLRAPGSRDERVVLYLHGGGYVMGSLTSHRKLAGDLARASSARVLLVEYRLAPEHPHPAAVHDAVAAYDWVLAEVGDAAAVALAGDSAGAGLTLGTLVALRDAGRPMPAAAVCISPWADLACEATTYESQAPRDPIVALGQLQRFAGAYLAGADAHHPTASPRFADLAGLPPLLVQVGDAEILRDDAVAVAASADAAGVDVTLEIWPDMIHDWHIFAGRVPEATEAVERIGGFLDAHLRPAPAIGATTAR